MNASELSWQRLPADKLSQDPVLAQAWDGLNAARRNLPFLAAPVVATALKVFGDGQEQLVIASIEGRICAMFLLRPQGRWRWATFQPSQLPLGAWVSDGSFSVATLARSMQTSVLSPCLVVSVTQIDPWLEPRPAAANDSETSDYVETGWLEIGEDFEAYWALRGKNLRQNMRKQRKRLEADAVRATLQEHRGSTDMASCIERYGSIESKGWKAKEGTAIHPDNAQGKFYTSVFESAATAGEAVVYDYTFGDSLVAMDLCLQRDGLLVILKTSYDESIKHCSPAFLLRQDELQTLFQQGQVKRLEFYGKFMEWHSRWTDDKRMLYHFTQFRWSWLKLIARARRARAQADASAPVASSNSADDS